MPHPAGLETVQINKSFKRPTKFTSIRAKRVGEKYQTDLLDFGYNDGSTQWFKGEIVSERNDFYHVKFPGESGTQRYTFIDKKSPDYIEPASWRVVKS